MKRLQFIVAAGIGSIAICSIVAFSILHQASEELEQTQTRWGQYTFASDSNLQTRVHTSLALSRDVGK